jgi:hypothetical protein
VPVAARKRSPRQPGQHAAPSKTVGPGEFVVYPGVPGGVYDLLERLSAAAGDSPDFGSPGISLDRKRLTVRWFGELPGDLRALVDAAAGFDVVVQHTDFRPGDLRAEAERLVGEHPAVVVSAWARPEGDGIEVLAAPDAATDELASSYPLFVDVAEAPRT